jgi:hypothetical protein
VSDHPLVAAYLRRLAAASAGARPDRRQTLLDDVAAHLHDTVPPNATEDHARRLLDEFGAPEALAAEAFGTEDGQAGRHKRIFPRTIGIAAAMVAAVAVAATVAIAYWPEVDAGAGATQLASTQKAPIVSIGSVVTLHPSGPERTTTGRTYAEYVRAIETLPPLPPGAQYPEGVPAWPEPTEPAMVETGVGAVIASFTWLCAWESEYLGAKDAQAYDRVLVAEEALHSWRDITPYPPVDFDGWSGNVLTPLEFDDPSGVRADRPQACAQAGINNVTQ